MRGFCVAGIGWEVEQFYQIDEHSMGFLWPSILHTERCFLSAMWFTLGGGVTVRVAESLARHALVFLVPRLPCAWGSLRQRRKDKATEESQKGSNSSVAPLTTSVLLRNCRTPPVRTRAIYVCLSSNMWIPVSLWVIEKFDQGGMQ